MHRVILLVLLSLPLVAVEPPAPPPAAEEDGVVVYFSPNGGATDAIVAELQGATKSIDVQVYKLTSKPIAQALVAAHRRGVEVRVILDKSAQTDRYTEATFLTNQGLTVLIDAEHAIMHDKIMLIDRETVITGSFNFSRAAEDSNAENVVIIRGKPTIADAYVENWRNHASHAKPYQRIER